MIKLTRIDGEEVWVSPELVRIVSTNPEDSSATIVSMGKEQYANVTESPEEVTRKILEYKFAMARYPLAVAHDTKDGLNANVDEIYRLAGLEESNE